MDENNYTPDTVSHTTDNIFVFDDEQSNYDVNNQGKAIGSIDSDIKKTSKEIEADSDRGYRKIADKVVTISEKFLDNQHDKKSELRKKFSDFFPKILKWQFICLIIIILLDSFEFTRFSVDKSFLIAYISSVFVETLGTIGAMIAFAFNTKEESEIVGILNTVITNFQKYHNSEK